MIKLPENFELDRYGLHVRLVREEDAEFVVEMRTNPQNARFIHDTNPSIENQRAWIRQYMEREKEGEEYYFIFFDGNKPVGLYRLYSIHDLTYTGGSWICADNIPFEQAVATAVITREIAFEIIGFEYEDGFDGVHVDNKHVYKFNKMVGMHETGRFMDVKGEYIAMAMTKQEFEDKKGRLLKLIGYGE